jgi:hypothetical protein
MSASRVGSLKSLTLGALLVGGLSLTSIGVALAQDAEVPAHPAHIHDGTCDDLNPAPKETLSFVSVLMSDSDDENANTPQGVLTAGRVLLSTTEGVELSMEDILADAHSINIHLSEAEIDTYIACGEIGGVPVDGDLYIGIRDVNGSGYSGVARLSEDGDSTNVDIFLTEPTDESAPATPAS